MARPGSLAGAILVALALLVALPALAREELRSYEVDILVLRNGTLEITETIVATTEQDRIKHGLFRAISKYRVVHDGYIRHPVVTFLSVERDGAPEPFRVEDEPDLARIYMGDADRLLDPGVHTYRLRYRISASAAIFNETGNGFAWPVVGGDWDFPILSAVARVRLPDDATLGTLAANVGRAKDEDAGSWTRVSATEAMFVPKVMPGNGNGPFNVSVFFEGGLKPYAAKLDQVP